MAIKLRQIAPPNMKCERCLRRVATAFVFMFSLVSIIIIQSKFPADSSHADYSLLPPALSESSPPGWVDTTNISSVFAPLLQTGDNDNHTTAIGDQHVVALPRKDRRSCREGFPKIYVAFGEGPGESLLVDNVRAAAKKSIAESLENGRSVQENIATEWAWVQLFESNPCRANTIEEADLIFVPYMHTTDCFSREGYTFACSQVPKGDIESMMVQLKRMVENGNTHVTGGKWTAGGKWDRFLFIAAYSDAMLRPQMTRNIPLRLTAGPSPKGAGGRNGVIITPIFNDHPRYQPSVVRHRTVDWWTTRHRKYSVALVAGTKLNPHMNRRKQVRRLRKPFFDQMKKMHPDGTMGNRTYVLGEDSFFTDAAARQQQHNSSTNGITDLFQIYFESTLCPILPGDSSWQRRFFDVIGSGCIPAVMEWGSPSDGGTGEKSWFVGPGKILTNKQIYPFMKDDFGDYNHTTGEGVDYESFVVTAPGNVNDSSDWRPLLKVMEEVLSDPIDLKRRQLNMKKYVTPLLLGVGPDAHSYDDAFYHVMLALKDYTHNLESSTSNNAI